MAKVDYERRGAASLLTITRPERRNAVDSETAELLLDGFRRFEEDDEARVLVLTGEGPEAFCAGADLKAVAERARVVRGLGPARGRRRVARRLPRRPDGLHPADRLEADDRRDLGLVPGRAGSSSPSGAT